MGPPVVAVAARTEAATLTVPVLLAGGEVLLVWSEFTARRTLTSWFQLLAGDLKPVGAPRQVGAEQPLTRPQGSASGGFPSGRIFAVPEGTGFAVAWAQTALQVTRYDAAGKELQTVQAGAGSIPASLAVTSSGVSASLIGANGVSFQPFDLMGQPRGGEIALTGLTTFVHSQAFDGRASVVTFYEDCQQDSPSGCQPSVAFHRVSPDGLKGPPLGVSFGSTGAMFDDLGGPTVVAGPPGTLAATWPVIVGGAERYGIQFAFLDCP